MRVTYRKSVLEKILEERKKADIQHKQIDRIDLNESEARELVQETLKNPMQLPPDLRGHSERTLYKRGYARVFGVDVHWAIEDEEF
jgi:hypothetical protein